MKTKYLIEICRYDKLFCVTINEVVRGYGIKNCEGCDKNNSFFCIIESKTILGNGYLILQEIKND